MTSAQPPRRVIVHIGAQKTGSTSLHRFLARNHDRLKQRFDVRVPEKGSLTRELGRTCALYSLRPAKHEADLVSLIQQVRAELEHDDRVYILSHENICGAMMGRADVREMFPRVADIVGLFETHLAPYAPEYVLYTRDIEGWKRSVHNQAVKSDGYAGALETFLEETKSVRGWDAVASELQGLVGVERVRIFELEQDTTPDRPGRQLLRFAGLSDDEIDQLEPLAGRSNQSLNPGALEFMRQLNQLALAQPARKQVAELIKNNQTLFADGPMPSQQA